MDWSNNCKLINGDCSQEIDSFDQDSISLSLWSPPYFVGKEYEKDWSYDEWFNLINSVIQKHQRILIPGGFMVINIADIKCFEDPAIPKFQTNNISNKKSKVTREMVLDMQKQFPNLNKYQLADKLNCSEQTIDRRINGTNIRGGKYKNQTRIKLSGAAIEEISYKHGLYLYDHRIWKKDPSWVNSRWTSNSYKGVDEFEDIFIFWKPGETIIDKNRLSKKEWTEWGSRSIWDISSVRKNDDHPAKFPYLLAYRIIKLFSEENSTILDPFLGSGTSGMAAIDLKRKFIGIEKSSTYFATATKNIKKNIAQLKLDLK